MRPFLVIAGTVLALAGGFGTPPAARGAILVFNNQAAFFQAAVVVNTENFDALPSGTVLGVGSVTLGGVTYTSDNPAGEWSAASILITSSPPNSLTVRNNAPPLPATLTFGGGSADAVGFFLNRGAQPSQFDLIVTTTAGEQLTESLVFGAGSPAGPAYRGFVAPAGVTSVRVVPVAVGGTVGNFFLDDVSRGSTVAAIPEPSALTLLGCGLAGVVGYSRWRKRAAKS